MSDELEQFARQSMEADYAYYDGRLDEWLAEQLERERAEHGDLERELERGRAIVRGTVPAEDVAGEVQA